MHVYKGAVIANASHTRGHPLGLHGYKLAPKECKSMNEARTCNIQADMLSYKQTCCHTSRHSSSMCIWTT